MDLGDWSIRNWGPLAGLTSALLIGLGALAGLLTGYNSYLPALGGPNGLLYDVTREISDLNLDIASAHIATFGEKAVDVFYVTDLTGKKITSTSREGAIRERLIKALQARQEPALLPA